MRFRGLIITGALLVSGAAGCSSDDGAAPATTTRAAASTTATTVAGAPSTSAPGPTTTTTPDQAPKLPDRFTAEAIPAAEFGAPVDLGGGLVVTISEPSVANDDQHPWVEVDVVAEVAADGTATAAPGVQLVCSGRSVGGGNLETETYEVNAPMAPGSTVEGTAQLVLPGDEGYGDPQNCLDPAYVRVDSIDASGELVQRRFDVSSALVREINDRVADRQCAIAPSGCAPPTD